MKKTMIITYVLISAVGFLGCTKADVEKMPVIIDDQAAVGDTFLSEEDIIQEEETADTTNSPQGSEDEYDNVEDTSYSSDELENLTIELEGMKEEINGKRYVSSLGYQMVYDMDRFKVSNTDSETDSYMADNPNPEIYPYVYLNIYRHDKAAYDKAVTFDGKIENPWTDLWIGDAYYRDEITIGTYLAKHYKSTTGRKWDSIIKDYYFIEHGDFYYVIETQYFYEAAEGYGARMKAMMDTIEFE